MCALLLLPAIGRSPASPPDLTRGETVPEEATHDWNLGATGARGWIYSDRLVTTDARQIAVTRVAPGSPADGILAEGDVILGVSGGPFTHDPRTELGRALTLAETEPENGRLQLTRWRDGATEEVVIPLPVLGSYSPTAPFDCAKSSRILELGCEALARRMEESGYGRGQNAITRSLNALALLASGDPQYLPLVKREAEWAANFTSDNFQTWWYAYVIMLLAEYRIATGDDSLMPGMRRLALEAATGQSIVGSWGHRFAEPDGRLGGYGMMNAPGVPLTISLVLARKAGLDDPAVDLAIERSARLIRFYTGKGAIPYGDHAPWTETHEDNGKAGMAAVLFHLLEEPEGAVFFTRMSVASHGPERDTGHTGNFTNMTWAMPSVALGGPRATGAWMKEFGSWYFDLARTWDHRFPHPGPPQARPDSFGGWDATGAYLLAYAMPLRHIHLTGKESGPVPQLDAGEVDALISAGRGWDNKDRISFYDGLAVEQLMTALGSWSPTVRERAAQALARRGRGTAVPEMVTMLDSGDVHSLYGACEGLIHAGAAGAPAVPALLPLLDHEDLWVRVKAAEALGRIGEPAMAAVPVLLERLAVGPTADDPRGMEQRFLSFTLFDRRRGMLSRSIEGVDRGQLLAGVAAGLRNQDGRARSDISNVYSQLSFEEIKPLLPAIYAAVAEPAPSGIMFADGVRVEGLRLLAKHRVKEGIEACVTYIRDQNKWASEKRTPELIEILLSYGGHAKAVIPQLSRLADEWEQGEDDFPPRLSRQKAGNLRDAIEKIGGLTEYPELVEVF